MLAPLRHRPADTIALASPAAPAISAGTAASPFARDLQACLAERPHAIAPKYFYDAAGSRLFDRICDLPEYYLTRTEFSILGRDIGAMAALIGPGAEIVEFGAGSLIKARLLLDALESPRRFVAVDISGEHLVASLAALQPRYPALDLQPLVADFTHPETLPLGPGGGRRVGFFPGSTIGNFTPEEASRFLSAASRLLQGGGLLIGVDLIKDPARLHVAYNDRAGVTAAFNRNLLGRANRELGTNFQVEAFQHYAFYQPERQRVEMHLINTRAQQIVLGGRSFYLAPGEFIHTENSQKYSVEGFQDLAVACGFRPRAVWCDGEGLFSLHWLEAVPN
ncbi:MAG: L-histidine N(alpha)-methyltransferase [Betaproteobacteria bacterium]|nr:L-histidine N(alpha)-methyltransferase [Betaproteobacteria bacterium]